MANKNTNPVGGEDDNEMRIQFGLILTLCQNFAISHNPLFHAQNSNLFKGRPGISIKTNPPFAVLGSVMCSVSFKCSKTSLRKPYWRTYGRSFSQRMSCTSFSTANSSVAIPGTVFLLCANARATSGTAANRRLV